MYTAPRGFSIFSLTLLSPFFFKAVAHFCRNYVNEKLPCSEDKHSSRKPLCSTTKWGNTSQQIRSPTACLTCSGLVWRKRCFRCDLWHKAAVVVLWRSCALVDVVFGGEWEHAQLDAWNRSECIWQMLTDVYHPYLSWLDLYTVGGCPWLKLHWQWSTFRSCWCVLFIQ